FQSQVRIDGKGTDIHKTLWLAKPEKGIHEVTRSERRVHKCACERLFHAGCKMIDNRGARRRFSAICGRKKIADNNFHFLLGIESSKRFFEAAKPAARANETTDISKAAAKERIDYVRSDKAIGSSD